MREWKETPAETSNEEETARLGETRPPRRSWSKRLFRRDSKQRLPERKGRLGEIGVELGILMVAFDVFSIEKTFDAFFDKVGLWEEAL